MKQEARLQKEALEQTVELQGINVLFAEGRNLITQILSLDSAPNAMEIMNTVMSIYSPISTS